MAVTRIWDADNGTWQLVGGAPGSGLGETLGPPVRYTTPGSHTFSKGDFPGAIAFIIECQGGGGGSGGASATTTANSSAGRGGGGGGFARSRVPASDLDTTEAITVGAGGLAGLAGNNAGGDGGDSIFDTISNEVRGNGGAGGAGAVASTGLAAEPGSANGGDGVGDLVVPGANGGILLRLSAVIETGGYGGDAFLGHGGKSGQTAGSLSNPGSPGGLYGGGAGGGASGGATHPAIPGHPGGDGIVIVTPVYPSLSGSRIIGGGYVPGDPTYYAVGSHTFTKADFPGAVAFLVQMVGGGGGGAGSDTTTASQQATGGGGSGAGYAESIVEASDLDVTEAITVGAPGAGGVGADGGDGTDSVFDTISGEVRAKAGQGGIERAANAGPGSVTPVAPLTGNVGDFVINGGRGQPAMTFITLSSALLLSGSGGDSVWGLGGGARVNTGTGVAGSGYGSGGGGAASGVGQSGQTGSVGQPGLVVVTPLYKAAEGAGGGGNYLPLSGGTLTGPLVLAADPTDLLGAATKQYVDAQVGGVGVYLPLAGGSLTGFLTLHANPTSTMHAATKDYVDDKFVAHHASTSADHDDRYYTEAQVNNLLDDKANVHSHPYAASSHTHAYAPSSHTHSYLPLSGGTVTGQTTFSNRLYINEAWPNYVLPQILWPYHGGSNGSIRWMGIGVALAQNHTSSSQDYKGVIESIDFSKSIFNRLDPIWFRYRDDHPFRDRWSPTDFDENVNPESVGRMGFDYEQVKAEAPHWAYETDGMKAIGYDQMLPDFIAWATAAIRELQARG